MKERGIPMSGMNIAPILADIKTHTRRATMNPLSVMGFRHWHGRQWERLDSEGRVLDMINCKYGEAGDRLWVREAWRVGKPHDNKPPRDIWPRDDGKGVTVLYEAGGWLDKGGHMVYPDNEPMPQWAGRYRHARFMPRWASRILLEITDIRVERLQDISEEDAKAEGVEPADCCHAYYHAYRTLWESINGPGSWAENPWVWVIVFKMVES